MHSIRKKAIRQAVMTLLCWLPDERRMPIERWLRGREDMLRLARCDVAVVSYGKSGRTWLRVMMSRYYQLVFGVPEHVLLGFTNYNRRHAAIPKIFFTHDNYINDYTGDADSKAAFYARKVVLLVRDPRDIAVSHYFHWKHRMCPVKKKLNGFPPDETDMSVHRFVADEQFGLRRIIDYLNGWASEAGRIEELLIVRYEDIREDPEGMLHRVMDFVNGAPPDARAIAGAVEYASVGNMRNLEEGNVLRRSGGRMKPGKKGEPDSYKVRRAKVGGYRDYFSEQETAQIDERVRRDLSDTFGYESPPHTEFGQAISRGEGATESR